MPGSGSGRGCAAPLVDPRVVGVILLLHGVVAFYFTTQALLEPGQQPARTPGIEPVVDHAVQPRFQMLAGDDCQPSCGLRRPLLLSGGLSGGIRIWLLQP